MWINRLTVLISVSSPPFWCRATLSCLSLWHASPCTPVDVCFSRPSLSRVVIIQLRRGWILYSVQICRWTDRQPRQSSVLMWYQMDRGGWIEIWKSINPSTSFRCWLNDWLALSSSSFSCWWWLARPSLSSLHSVIDGGGEGKVCKSP